MLTLLVFNAAMIAMGGAVSFLVPPSVLTAWLYWFHVSLGITAPRPENSRLVAWIWIGATTGIVDGLALILIWLT